MRCITTCSLWIAAVMMALLSCPAFAAGEALTLSDVAELAKNRKTSEQILEQMRERGVGFEVSKSTELRLKRYGFTDAQIAEVKKLKETGPSKKPDEQPKGDDKADKPGDEKADPGAGPGLGGDKPKAAPPAGDRKFGPRMPDSYQDAAKNQVERIIAKAGINVMRFECENVTIVASIGTGGALKPFAMKLEADIARRFGGVLVEGPDKRSATIAVLDTRYEYEKWIHAMFDVFQGDGMQFGKGGGGDPRTMALEAPGFLTTNICSNDAQTLASEEKVKRQVAYQVGYLYMQHITEGRCPTTLATGFGNVAEVMAMGTPSVMLYSYSKRDLGGGGNPWAAAVLDRFQKQTISKPKQVWGMDTSTMKFEEYAEAWSLVSTLCEKAKTFEKLVVMERDSDEPIMTHIGDLYGIKDEKDLMKAWYAHTMAQK